MDGDEEKDEKKEDLVDFLTKPATLHLLQKADVLCLRQSHPCAAGAKIYLR